MKKSLNTLLVTALGASCLIAVAGATPAKAATSPKTLVTCQNIKTGANRILIKGSCKAATEKKISWVKITKFSTGAITLCTNVKTGSSRILSKGTCTSKTEVKSIWKKKIATSIPVALTCAKGGKCARKDIGPGGGLVFYVADSRQVWGQYLEVAPATWQGSSDPQSVWCNIADSNITTLYEIGDGRANTATLGTQCSTSASMLAKAYKGGGKSDWYLPSYKEIKELHGFVYGLDIKGFSPDFYWSSSQDGVTTAWAENFGNQGSVVASKSTLYLVRPIRAF